MGKKESVSSYESEYDSQEDMESDSKPIKEVNRAHVLNY
jgi:hypothetical protein